MIKYALLIFFILKIGCSSNYNSSYTLTDFEKELFYSIQNQDMTSATQQVFDEDGNVTTLKFQQTIDINTLNIGDTITTKRNMINSLLSDHNGNRVSVNVLNTSITTISNIIGILGDSNGLFFGSTSGFYTTYRDNSQAYKIFTSTNNLIVKDRYLSFEFSDNVIFIGRFSGIKPEQTNQNATSHDDVSCNQNDSYTYTLFTLSGTPISTTEETQSGYAEIIQYKINNGDEIYLKACI
ncbi:MAG: hypothetical protein VXX85_02315 [Candidatus Margulisiibacteriota bacterium]|nr:hypothetical protein [Candidatus Margulisiibacteriota bacterium]